MDNLLCDELVQEILQRLPPPSAASVSLVCKRWHRLLRHSTASLSVQFPHPYDPTIIASFSAFLAQHPFLDSLSIIGSNSGGGESLLIAVASSCPNLRRLRLLCSQVSPTALYTLSSRYCGNFNSISLTVARPLSFNWLNKFTSLKSLSVSITNLNSELTNSDEIEQQDDDDDDDDDDGDEFNLGLNLESLSLSGILPGDYGLRFLWKNCVNVRKLQLMNCASLGDYSMFSGFLRLLSCLKELELRTCRSIIDVVLLKLSEACISLDSLLVHDGGSRDALLHFITHSKCSLTRLDLRLPLDLENAHLIALSENLNLRELSSLRLQSCGFVTGEGLKAIGMALSDVLEELALINCDVVGREPGLLTTLGQNLRRLRKLDLSYNDTLSDKEFVSMLASSISLVELKLRGCNRLTNIVTSSMVRSCKQLQDVDISLCSGIHMEGVELFVMNSPRLRRVEVEQSKVSEAAKAWASAKFIEVIS